MHDKNLVRFDTDGAKTFRFAKVPKININKYKNILEQMEKHRYGSNEYYKCKHRLKMMIKDANGVK